MLALMCAALLIVVGLAMSGSGAARAADGCSSAPTPGDHAVQMSFDGLSRSALIYVPPGIAAGKRVPLVLALHGTGGTGAKMEPYSGFSLVAAKHGFVVAYPTAAGPSWNISEARTGANDVGFLGALITQLQRTYCVDSQRIFAAGVSNGGGMAALLGCALSTRLAAIAPVAGVYNQQPPCHTTHPVSLLEIHGTADQVAAYTGRKGARVTAAPPPFVTSWVHRDRCSPKPSSTSFATRTTLYRWSSCAGRAIVEHLRIAGGRHQWPGAVPPDPGPASTFCGACVIWSFFSALPTAPPSGDGGTYP